MTDLGSLNYFLGVSITHDSSEMILSQRKYATKILERAHMVGCNSSQTPIDSESKLDDDAGLPLHEPHFSALKWILRYVRCTLDYGLQLFASSTTSLVAYSDADWAGCPTTQRSNFGYCVFHGVSITHDSSEMILSQRKYATKILERAHMVGCNSSQTHVDSESKLDDDAGLPLHEPHFSALKRILRYVRCTLDYGLQLFASSTTSLVAYSDADWAGCPTT
uniref:Reverse transcriptase Ty1/copia-type domain-containing protein n=1 Tax=Tanacetum cinerariifolium TaxID=118510 RepID=A0A6L2M588_TANCI|nr:hypothetical protein [Tanacetum cinerariifolium]